MSTLAQNRANLGMYAETIIQRSCDYYRLHNIAFFEKRQLPIKIIKKVNDSIIVGKLLCKSYVDFFGSYQGKHIEFEVKETTNDDFLLSLLKSHQLEYLEQISKQNIQCFLIVYFSKHDEFYRINFEWLSQFIKTNNTKKIPYKEINQNAILLKITFPGIINFLST